MFPPLVLLGVVARTMPSLRHTRIQEGPDGSHTTLMVGPDTTQEPVTPQATTTPEDTTQEARMDSRMTNLTVDIVVGRTMANACGTGYYDTCGGNENYWACGSGCASGQYYTDAGCGCCCQLAPTPAPLDSGVPRGLSQATAWTQHTLKHCYDERLSTGTYTYSSVEEAQDQCFAMGTCWGVYDSGCDESPGDVYLCDASQITTVSDLATSSSSCVYEKLQASDYCYYVSGTCYIWASPCSGGCSQLSDFSSYSWFCPGGIRYATEAEWSTAEPVLIANRAGFYSKCAASVMDPSYDHCDSSGDFARVPDGGSNEQVVVCDEAPVVSGTGDPHLSNIRGEHFDLYEPGIMALLHLPRFAEPSRTLLLVEADARRMGDVCSVYFQVVTISGIWTNDSKPIRFLANPHGTPEGRNWKEWMRFGPIDLKVSRQSKDVEYLNVYARNVDRSGYDVGGLLGLDDHAAVASRPRQCANRHAVSLASVARAQQ